MANFNGGYIMVDATGLDVSVTDDSQTVTGLYDRLEEAITTGKPVMLCGAVNGDSPVSPAFVTVSEGAGASFTLGTFTAVVASDDSVTPVPAE